MGNGAMYHEFLEKFLFDGSFEEFYAGVAINDLTMAKKALHTLKGTSANLSLERLYAATKEMSKAIDEGASPEVVSDLANCVCEVYGKTCDAVREHL